MTNQELLNRIAELERDAEIKYENHKRIVADLTEQAERWEDDALRLMEERNKALKERDEARREACGHGETIGGAMLEAELRGWDCFKENK